MEADVLELLERVFGLAALRPQQLRAVDAFMHGRDVLAVLPTGYGKSLCFQLPAVALARRGAGCTLVVSPLIALMDDQVAALRARGVRAHALHSAIPWSEQRTVLRDLGGQELVYVSPERLENAHVRRALSGVARVAIDEAHCISEWGHEFRPEYARLGWLKRTLGAPLMALTATATARVREHVLSSLEMRDAVRVEASALRPNLQFQVALAPEQASRTAWAVELLRTRGFAQKRADGRALVYAATRGRAQAVQRALRQAGIRAGYYHAGRRASARTRAQALFQRGSTPVLVATSAFGMGIDMPDVRLVVHVESPGTLEGYVQQAGRAGRAGGPAECWLAFAAADARIHERLRGARPAPGAVAGFQALVDYAWSNECRQRLIARYLDGADGAACGACDVCRDHAQVERERAQARAAQARAAEKRARRSEDRGDELDARACEQVVAFIDALAKPVGRRYAMMALRGSKARVLTKKRLTKNPHFGALRGASEAAIYRALDALLRAGRLAPKGKKYPTLWIAGKPVRAGRPRAEQAPHAGEDSRAGEGGRAAERARARGLEAALKRFRRNEARRRRIKPYQVFHNQTLRALCSLRPATREALREVWGIGEERLERYGSALLELCAHS